MDSHPSKYFQSFILSIGFHIIGLLALSWLLSLDYQFQLLDFSPEQRRLEISQISREDMQSLRRAGVESSTTKDNILIEEMEMGEEQAESEESSEQQTSDGELSLESLGFILDSEVIAQKESSPPPESHSKEEIEDDRPHDLARLRVTRDSSIQTPFVDRETAVDQLALQSRILRQMGVGDAADFARRGNMFMRFEPPEGIDPDELNTIEKMFYGFQIRVFENYIRALMTSYNELQARNPRLKNQLQSGRYNLAGRVTFDREGNIVSLRITRWTNQTDVQELFERSLQNINKLPNIPSELMGDSDRFNIYYILQIN